MPKGTWKRVRVVVECPILGAYSENDFKYDVEEALRSHLKMSARGLDIQFGRFTVKSFARTTGRTVGQLRQL